MPANAAPEAPPDLAAGRLLSRRASLRIGAVLAGAAVLIFAIGRWTDIDLGLADWMVDRAAGRFPWRDAWLTDTFSHAILKHVLTLGAAAVIVLALIDAAWPLRRVALRGRRLRLRITAWSALLVPLVISLLKRNSNAHCPWDLARYGGAEPYLRLFDALPAGVAPGHCLPGGHASTALWMVALAVWWLPGAPVTAFRVGIVTLGAGFAVGWMQQMRGAHFLTHTLWSMWLACAIVFLLIQGVQRGVPSRVTGHVGPTAQGRPW